MKTVGELCPPSDYLAPKWGERDKVHGWRNYITEDLQEAWDTFTEHQKP